jgi:alkylated DNA repair dioxygenase AlkB
MEAREIPPCQRIELPDADVRYWPQAIDAERADALFSALRAAIDWQQEHVVIFGQQRLVPRLVAWHGDAEARYTYSGTAHEPQAWTPELLELRAVAEALTGQRYDSVLLNLYRDGRDGMGWHADDEPELGQDPAIASISLGATRRFRLRHRRSRHVTELELGHGSLLSMAGPTQHHYVHSVPKTARSVGERINLTFRLITSRERSRESAGEGGQRSTIDLKPPQNMRLPSNGMALGSMYFLSRGSAMNFLLTRSRSLRDLCTMYENTTVSPGFSLTLRGNEVHLPGLTSSATAST